MLPFQLQEKLIYIENRIANTSKLCISSALVTTIFKKAHNKAGHPDYLRTHKKVLLLIFIHRIAKKLHQYILNCPQCHLNQTS